MALGCSTTRFRLHGLGNDRLDRAVNRPRHETLYPKLLSSHPKETDERSPTNSPSQLGTLCAQRSYLNGVYFSFGTLRALL